MEKARELSMDEMEKFAGGAGSSDTLHDLSMFIHRTVCNVIHYDDSACLTLRKTPNGTIIPGVGWQNGESILIHCCYTEDGWYFAYKGGKFGYVNPNNIR